MVPEGESYSVLGKLPAELAVDHTGVRRVCRSYSYARALIQRVKLTETHRPARPIVKGSRASRLYRSTPPPSPRYKGRGEGPPKNP